MEKKKKEDKYYLPSRSKIEADGGAPYIKTVYGMGYQWTGGEVT